MVFTVRYLRDEEVDEALDKELRALLLQCFPHEAHHLKTKRYFHECPQNRWFAYDENGTLAAHLAAYEKVIGAGDADLEIIGIAEVCVAPQFRGQGLVKTLIEQAHNFGKEKGFAFSVLGGDHRIYSSSGYTHATNPIATLDVSTGRTVVETRDYILFRPLSNQSWPTGEINFRGPTF